MERYLHLRAGRGRLCGRHAKRRVPGAGRDLVVGQWGLVPWFAKTQKLPYLTNNARVEKLAAKATFKHPWARGQRCITNRWCRSTNPTGKAARTFGGGSAGADGQLWGIVVSGLKAIRATTRDRLRHRTLSFVRRAMSTSKRSVQYATLNVGLSSGRVLR